MVRVLVVEDSPTDRALVVEVLASDPEIEVVGQAKDGVEAVQLATQLRPDLIAMDVFMPRMDGFEATREIMVVAPTPILLFSSSASEREVELTLKAIEAGALVIVEKPGDPQAEPFDGRKARFLAMVKAMSQVHVVRRWSERSRSVAGSGAGSVPWRGPKVQPRIVVVGASTGGPAALRQMLSGLPEGFPVPLLVVQHIARGFVAGLAHWLGADGPLRVKVAEDGEPLAGGTVYFAPDDRHLAVRANATVQVAQTPPVDGFRPSASVLFETAAEVYRTAVAAVILTGMGNDGVRGLRAVKAVGGTVIAQDEATSIVYGMPREAVLAGVVDVELPLSEIGPRLSRIVVGGRHGHQHPRR